MSTTASGRAFRPSPGVLAIARRTANELRSTTVGFRPAAITASTERMIISSTPATSRPLSERAPSLVRISSRGAKSRTAWSVSMGT